jgi:hypothetical protein
LIDYWLLIRSQWFSGFQHGGILRGVSNFEIHSFNLGEPAEAAVSQSAELDDMVFDVEKSLRYNSWRIASSYICGL